MKSKIMAVFLVVLMLVSTVPITITAQDKEHETFLEAKEDALRWLEQQKQEDGCYGDRQLINDTCEALKVLPEQEDSYNDFLDNWYEEEYVGNQDMLARYSVATDDEWLVESFIYDQNDDGGFGLTSQYESDVWDSLLVLEAYIDEYSEEITESGDELINYLCQMQNEDGGWSFNPSSGSDPLLSARTGHDILEYLLVSEGKSKEIEDKIMLLDDFLKENGNLSLEKDNFQEYGYSFLYFNRRGCGEENLPNVQEFLDTQKADGSFYDNVSDTVLAIRLLDIMEEKSRLVLNVSHLDTELSSYVIQSGEEEEITLFGTVSYSVNKNWDLRYKVSILDSDGTTILEQTEQMVTVSPEMKEVKTEPYSFHLKVDEEKELTVLSELYDGENQLAKDRKTIKVKQSQSTEELNVTADITNGKDYQVELSWNDISNQEMLYGYRILRKKDGCEWETRSSWDGEEKVKVLHVYPCSQVKDCLKNWMEQTTNDGEQPAGKGLFDIDAVFIQDYNNKPDAYLLNEEGRYKYDVIFFGSYDGNASQDLTEQSYQATEKFLDSGRGVLFGHDTITRVQYQKHPVFSRFAERLGIYAKDCPNFDYDTLNRNMCTEVNVVNSGFLTSYPWKLSGTLDIATSHNLEQYAGGSLPSTVWMEFTTPYKIIEATGAKNNGYLFTNNQLAMIQTGHSAGQTTEDERKVFANTLFYLKQFTEKTSAIDQSFYDEEKPDAPNIVMLEQKEQENQYQLTADILSKDNGTNYQYYIEGMQKNHSEDSKNVCSNVVDAKALSEIRGYLIDINESSQPMKELVSYEKDGVTIANVIPAVNGSLQYQIDLAQSGQDYYMHVYAVDWANNVSEETVEKIRIDEKKEAAELQSKISLDKEELQAGESLTIQMHASSSKGKGTARGVLTLLDEQGNRVETLNANLSMELGITENWTKDITWDAKGLMTGKYYIQLDWYQDELLFQKTTKAFYIHKDGGINNHVTVDKDNILKDSKILVEDRIENTSTNAIESDFNVSITVYDTNHKEVLKNTETIDQLLMLDAKEMAVVFDLNGLEEGLYTVESIVTSKENTISKSTTTFTICTPSITHSFTGEIETERDENKQVLSWNVSNSAGGDTITNADVKVSIIHVESKKLINEIHYSDDFKCGERKEYQQAQDISELEEGDYLAILTVEVPDKVSEKTLDAVFFHVERKETSMDTLPILCATEKSVTIECAEAKIDGDVYSAGDFVFNGSILNLDGTCSTGGKVVANGWKIQIANKEEQATLREIPYYSYELSGTEQDFPYCTSLAIEQNLVRKESITINANDVQIGMSAPVVVASLEGDITINASNLNENGFIYAPNGTVYLNIGGLEEIKGRIIAKEIHIQGTTIQIKK